MTDQSKPAQATSGIAYEELLEEMGKLDIADLLLIHRKIVLRWARGPNASSLIRNISIYSIQANSTFDHEKSVIHTTMYQVKWSIQISVEIQ